MQSYVLAILVHSRQSSHTLFIVYGVIFDPCNFLQLQRVFNLFRQAIFKQRQLEALLFAHSYINPLTASAEWVKKTRRTYISIYSMLFK